MEYKKNTKSDNFGGKRGWMEEESAAFRME